MEVEVRRVVTLRKAFRVLIHMNFLNVSVTQESCKIWYVIMRNLYKNEVIEEWKTVGMKAMKVIELFTILSVPYADDEIILSNSDEPPRVSYNLFKSN
jgi:hypothetical protein